MESNRKRYTHTHIHILLIILSSPPSSVLTTLKGISDYYVYICLLLLKPLLIFYCTHMLFRLLFAVLTEKCNRLILGAGWVVSRYTHDILL